MIKEDNKEHLIRMLKWIGDNPHKWFVIFDYGGNEKISDEMFQELKNELIKESFFELLLVLLSVYQNQRSIGHAIHKTLMSWLADEINNDDGNKLITILENDF